MTLIDTPDGVARVHAGRPSATKGARLLDGRLRAHGQLDRQRRQPILERGSIRHNEKAGSPYRRGGRGAGVLLDQTGRQPGASDRDLRAIDERDRVHMWFVNRHTHDWIELEVSTNLQACIVRRGYDWHFAVGN